MAVPVLALAQASSHVANVLVAELSNGQMLEDVRLATNGKKHVDFYGRVGGNVPSVEELRAQVGKHIPTPLDVFALRDD